MEAERFHVEIPQRKEKKHTSGAKLEAASS